MATDNPYAPPKSNVDTGSRRAIETRPAHVTYAVWLLWASIVLGIPTTVYDYRRSLGEGGDVAGPILIVIYVLMYAFEMAVTILIGHGRNWARIAFLVLVALSVILIPPMLPQFLTFPASQLALNASIMAIDLAVIYLVFTQPGSLWFRRVDGT